jgi:hypothetical protein
MLYDRTSDVAALDGSGGAVAISIRQVCIVRSTGPPVPTGILPRRRLKLGPCAHPSVFRDVGIAA